MLLTSCLWAIDLWQSLHREAEQVTLGRFKTNCMIRLEETGLVYVVSNYGLS